MLRKVIKMSTSVQEKNLKENANDFKEKVGFLPEGVTDDESEFFKAFERNKNHNFKTLFSLYKGNYRRFIGAFVCFIIKHSPALYLPIATAEIIDVATVGGDGAVRTIITDVVLCLALFALNVPMHTLYTKLYSKAVRSVEANLRLSLVRKLQQLSISYHKHMQSGRLQSKIMRDVESIETLSSQLFTGVTNIMFDIIFALSVTLGKSIIVFLFFLVMVPLTLLLRKLFSKRLNKGNKEFRKEMENTSAQVLEMVEMIPVTKAHGLEKVEIEKMGGRLRKVADKGYKLDLVNSYFGAITWAAMQAMRVICLAFTGYLAYKGSISVGDVVLYQTYFTTIVTGFSTIISLMPIISKGMDSVGSVGDILLANDIEDNRGKKSVKKVNGDVTFQNVSFIYDDGNESVLDNFNLDVKQGETIAFVGESGSGKTTAVNMIIGFCKATHGKLLIDGQDIKELNLREYRHHLAVVPQNSILFSGSFRENITYGLEHITDEQIWEAVDSANLRDLVESWENGLDTVIGEHGDTLSGGQKQRISIARALIRDPRIIILDEATSALDTVSEKKIQSAIGNMSKGRTTFIVAHRLSTIKDADRIVVVKDGKCAEIGTYDELIEKKGAF